MKFRARTNEKRQLEARWDLVNVYCQRWKPGTILEIEIRRPVKTISDPMRKYYFAEVIAKLAEHLGYDKGQETLLFHNQLKAVYFNCQKDKYGMYKDVPSVFSNESKIPIEGKKKYVDWVIRVAAKEGVIIDDPLNKE